MKSSLLTVQELSCAKARFFGVVIQQQLTYYGGARWNPKDS